MVDEMRISDLSSDVCSSDLQVSIAYLRVGGAGDRGLVGDGERDQGAGAVLDLDVLHGADLDPGDAYVVPLDHTGDVDEDSLVLTAGGEGDVADQQIGRASCRERVCQYG